MIRAFPSVVRRYRNFNALVQSENAMMNRFHPSRPAALGFAFASAAIIVLSVSDATPQSTTPEPRTVPARPLPVPTTVSPEMQVLAGGPLAGNWDSAPTTVDEWRKLSAPGAGRNLSTLRERLGVKTEALTVNGSTPSW